MATESFRMVGYIARVVIDGNISYTVEWMTAPGEALEKTVADIARGYLTEARHDVTVELRREGERYDGKRYRVRPALEVLLP